MARKRQRLPSLASLYKKHSGLTRALSETYSESAAVCLSQHHERSPTEVVVDERGGEVYDLHWRMPTRKVQRAYNNLEDATRDAAYGVSIAAVEVCMGLFATGRADTRTGADYYLGPREDADELDLERSYRLEVSGVLAGDLPVVQQRMTQKLVQLREGASTLPGIAAVVGFKTGHVMIRPVEAEDP